MLHHWKIPSISFCPCFPLWMFFNYSFSFMIFMVYLPLYRKLLSHGASQACPFHEKEEKAKLEYFHEIELISKVEFINFGKASFGFWIAVAGYQNQGCCSCSSSEWQRGRKPDCVSMNTQFYTKRLCFFSACSTHFGSCFSLLLLLTLLFTVDNAPEIGGYLCVDLYEWVHELYYVGNLKAGSWLLVCSPSGEMSSMLSANSFWFLILLFKRMLSSCMERKSKEGILRRWQPRTWNFVSSRYWGQNWRTKTFFDMCDVPSIVNHVVKGFNASGSWEIV